MVEKKASFIELKKPRRCRGVSLYKIKLNEKLIMPYVNKKSQINLSQSLTIQGRHPSY